LGLAQVEMEGKALFDYFKKHQDEPQRQNPIEAPYCWGKGILVATYSSGRNYMWDAIKFKGQHR